MIDPRARFAARFYVSLIGRPKREPNRQSVEPHLPWLIVEQILLGKQIFSRDELLGFRREGLATYVAEEDEPIKRWFYPDYSGSTREDEVRYLGALFLAEWLHVQFDSGGEWLDVWQEKEDLTTEYVDPRRQALRRAVALKESDRHRSWASIGTDPDVAADARTIYDWRQLWPDDAAEFRVKHRR